MPAALTLQQKLFSFEGRMRRQDYWTTIIGLNVVTTLVSEIVIRAVFGPEYSVFGAGFAGRDNRLFHPPALTFELILDAATLWPVLAMAAKRAHDRDKSARVVMVLTGAAYALNYLSTCLVAGGVLNTTTAMFVDVPSLALLIYLVVVVGCLEGTPGPNRFGPSPKAPDSDPAEVFS